MHPKRAALFAVAALLMGRAAAQAATATRVRVQNNRCFATIDGREREITVKYGAVTRALIIEDGNAIVLADRNGWGGYEGEGQTLWRYEVSAPSRPLRPLLREELPINDIRIAHASDGRLALIVSMSDGGAGIPSVAVVHPRRGRVWVQHNARMTGVQNGRVSVAFYPKGETGHEKPPVRTASYNLGTLLDRPAARIR